MDIKEKIYKLGLATLDELLLHCNTTKSVEVSITDAAILSDKIVYVNPHVIFTFNESEIAAFYRVWAKEHTGYV